MKRIEEVKIEIITAMAYKVHNTNKFRYANIAQSSSKLTALLLARVLLMFAKIMCHDHEEKKKIKLAAYCFLNRACELDSI